MRTATFEPIASSANIYFICVYYCISILVPVYPVHVYYNANQLWVDENWQPSFFLQVNFSSKIAEKNVF